MASATQSQTTYKSTIVFPSGRPPAKQEQSLALHRLMTSFSSAADRHDLTEILNGSCTLLTSVNAIRVEIWLQRSQSFALSCAEGFTRGRTSLVDATLVVRIRYLLIHGGASSSASRTVNARVGIRIDKETDRQSHADDAPSHSR
ncbi:hypothetical protein ST47_g8229 [Ascochyta rabiei]|uniref:Uncharacterized protein n=1 Tax=Didymella rabiei TaxID=5454 RepID=A0A162ZIB4_DIDRA|nr:hypothetical protein ST47_g8229 [Ascochyta rabiei]